MSPVGIFEKIVNTTIRAESAGVVIAGANPDRICGAIGGAAALLLLTRQRIGPRADLAITSLYLVVSGRWDVSIEPTDGDTFAKGDGRTIRIGREKSDTSLLLAVTHEIGHVVSKAGRLDKAIGLAGLPYINNPEMAATEFDNTLRMAIAILTGDPVCLRIDRPDRHLVVPLRPPCREGVLYRPGDR